MPPFLILHAIDSDLEARLICDKLNFAGFIANTYEDVFGHTSRQDILEARYELIDEAPAVIILASQFLFGNDALVAFALIAQQQHKIIPIIYRHEVELPAWFVNPILLNWDEDAGSQGWNKLSEALLLKVGHLFWQFPELPKPN